MAQIKSKKTSRILYLNGETYKEVWGLQKKLFAERLENTIDDTIIITEHPHVYTIGKKPGSEENLLGNVNTHIERGIEVHYVDRGGDITYHGPGQLVVYPILDLHQYYLDVHRYLRDLEQVIIDTLVDFEIRSGRITGLTGVWVSKEDKIASIGIKVSRWITMHGFALNVNTNLSYYNNIIPCGISNKKIVSMQRVRQKQFDMDQVVKRLLLHFCHIFNCEIIAN